MIDFDVLAQFNTTNDRLRQVFTADATKEQKPQKGESKDDKSDRAKYNRQLMADIKTRTVFQQLFQSRLYEQIFLNLRSCSMYAAVDLMWDTPVITQEVLPLLMYAQGKISVDAAKAALQGIGANNAVSKYIKKVGEGPAAKETVDLPRFVDSHFNLGRSLIARRHAAQKNRLNSLWPYYYYEARNTSTVGKCRADVMSQVAEIMVDQFGYRHHDSQVIQDGFLYGHSVDFPRKSWESESQIYFNDDGKTTRSTIVKEGVPWHNPHPSRVFWDNAHPMCSINTDSGCEYIGFWDVCRYRDIEDNPWYFNKGVIGWSSKIWNAFNQYTVLFQQYGYTITPPIASSGGADQNNRLAQSGIYNSTLSDSSIVIANYFHKCIPKDVGLGDYPCPVWIRFVVASDYTVIYAEIMPSSPAAVLSINENDSRQVNISMAMAAFTFQDAMSNLMTHMLLLMERELVTIIGINTDVITDKDKIADIRRRLQGRNWFADPIVIEQSFVKLEETLGPKFKEFLNIYQTSREPKSITDIFVAMAKLVEMAEKLFALSPNEQGQPAPREITATESASISTTTSAIYSSIGSDVNEFREAKKRIVYESVVACKKGQVVAPVKGRYTKETIEKAGFKITDADNDTSDPTGRTNITVIGSTQKLVHDYIFSSRDGDERPVNTQSANTLVQMLGMLAGLPGVIQEMGKEKLYNIINEIFRMSGAGFDMVLEKGEGESDGFGPDEMEQVKQGIQQLTQMTTQLGGHVQQNSTDIAKTEQELQRLDQSEEQMKQHLDQTNQVASIVKGHAKSIQDLMGQRDEIRRTLVENISYKDAPEDIRRQLELQAGLSPSQTGGAAPAPRAATSTKSK